ncbi:Lipoprotein LprI [Halioglobus japonicus]|nr:Lipoprotein LprI [Halioglobus japonicus]
MNTVILRMKWPRQLQRCCIVAAALLSAPAAHTREPAFDCAEAEGQVQTLVCTDDGLAQLDRELTSAYHTALEALPPDGVPQTKAQQRGWIKGRDDCWKADDVLQCVSTAYQTRIIELQIASGQLSAPVAISLDCGDSEQAPFFAAFYNDTSPPAVVLTRGQDQIIAFIARSGSGARYTSDGVEYWEHQGQASIDWFGTKLVCAVAK